MTLLGPDEYQVTVTNHSAAVRGKDGTAHFVRRAVARSRPKLYTVSKDGALLYVGVTTQSMSVRLRYGMTADGAHGYHGYSWGKMNQSLCLHIWYLDGENATATDLETVEAEAVFLYRQQSGQWPSAQTEIHFHASNLEHRKCAKQVLDALVSRT